MIDSSHPEMGTALVLQSILRGRTAFLERGGSQWEKVLRLEQGRPPQLHSTGGRLASH